MKLEIAKPVEPSINLDDEHSPSDIDVMETETIDVFDKFTKYIHQVEKDHHRIRKVVMSSELYRLMKQSDKYQRIVHYNNPGMVEKARDETLFGVVIEHEEFGYKSIADFLIYTDKKVIHSDMLDKTFLEDVEVEELIHETNNRIEDRENDS